MRLLQQ